MIFPDLYKEYYCYDDGKISHSRQYKVMCFKVFDLMRDINDDNREFIENCLAEILEVDWLFDPNPTHFLYTISYECEYPEFMIMAPTKQGNWFGLGRYKPYIKYGPRFDTMFCSGLLDLTGELTDFLERPQ